MDKIVIIGIVLAQVYVESSKFLSKIYSDKNIFLFYSTAQHSTKDVLRIPRLFCVTFSILNAFGVFHCAKGTLWLTCRGARADYAPLSPYGPDWSSQ
jgi:hypothetical protein